MRLPPHQAPVSWAHTEPDYPFVWSLSSWRLATTRANAYLHHRPVRWGSGCYAFGPGYRVVAAADLLVETAAASVPTARYPRCSAGEDPDYRLAADGSEWWRECCPSLLWVPGFPPPFGHHRLDHLPTLADCRPASVVPLLGFVLLVGAPVECPAIRWRRCLQATVAAAVAIEVAAHDGHILCETGKSVRIRYMHMVQRVRVSSFR